MHSSQPCAPPRRRRDRGFSLVEIMIAVLIIGMLIMLAMPAITKVHRASQSNRFISDLRTFAQAFETYSMMNGGWPATTASGAIPTGMSASEFLHGAWVSPKNSIGGQWGWDNEPSGAAVAVAGVTAPTSQMVAIDARIDDGNLSTGLFQLNGGRYLYYLQQP
jgi:prepilin-type N-terminal cleavage/methylation domain-containing protein